MQDNLPEHPSELWEKNPVVAAAMLGAWFGAGVVSSGAVTGATAGAGSLTLGCWSAAKTGT